MDKYHIELEEFRKGLNDGLDRIRANLDKLDKGVTIAFIDAEHISCPYCGRIFKAGISCKDCGKLNHFEKMTLSYLKGIFEQQKRLADLVEKEYSMEEG